MTDTAKALLSPEEIGLDFVPVRRAGLAQLQFGDEVVISCGPFEPCHLLNQTASMVWQCFDGQTDLSTLVDELAEATGLGREVIAAQVVEMTRHVGRAGLLAGIAPSPPQPQTLAGPQRLREGDVINDFEITDLSGQTAAWEDFRGRRLLLVNWSFACGYCLQITAELAKLSRPLKDKEVELVFVSSGSPEDNRQFFDAAGLGHVTVLCKQASDGPFAGLGTPVAYLVDEAGRIGAPIAYGALQVPQLAARLAGVEPTKIDGPTFDPVGAGMCGPTSRPRRVRTDWAGSAVFDLGGQRVGLRYNSPQTAVTLDRLFPGARIDDPDVAETYAIALHPQVDRAARQLNLLVRSGLQVLRGRSQARVLQGLLGHLSCLVAPKDPTLLHLDGVAVVRDGEAFLLPSSLYSAWRRVQPRLSHLGLHVADIPWVSVDPVSARVVISKLAVPYDIAVIEELDASSGPARSELPAAAPGEYPLQSIVLADPTRVKSEQSKGRLSQPAAVAACMGLVNSVTDIDVVLGQVARLFESTSAYDLGFDSPESFLDRLAALF